MRCCFGCGRQLADLEGVRAQAGVSEKKLRHLQLARRAATCMRWETMQGGRGAFDERGSGDEMISDADVMGPGGVASAPEHVEEALERGEKDPVRMQLMCMQVRGVQLLTCANG